jgi:hypothetical protein
MREKSLALLVAGGLAAALFTSSAFAGTAPDCDQDAPHRAVHARVHHHKPMHAAISQAKPAKAVHLVKAHKRVARPMRRQAEPVKPVVRCAAAAPSATGDCPCASPTPANRPHGTPYFTMRTGEWERLQ